MSFQMSSTHHHTLFRWPAVAVRKVARSCCHLAVYHKLDMKTGTFDFSSGFVVPESAGSPPADLSTWSIPQVQALAVEHTGSYEHLGNAWIAANQYARYKKLKQSKTGCFEIYKNDSKETPPAELRTEIFLPLK